MYIALRTLQVGPGDVRDVGDAVPEANEWPNVGLYIQNGWIAGVPDEDYVPKATVSVTETSTIEETPKKTRKPRAKSAKKATPRKLKSVK